MGTGHRAGRIEHDDGVVEAPGPSGHKPVNIAADQVTRCAVVFGDDMGAGIQVFRGQAGGGLLRAPAKGVKENGRLVRYAVGVRGLGGDRYRATGIPGIPGILPELRSPEFQANDSSSCIVPPSTR